MGKPIPGAWVLIPVDLIIVSAIADQDAEVDRTPGLAVIQSPLSGANSRVTRHGIALTHCRHWLTQSGNAAAAIGLAMK